MSCGAESGSVVQSLSCDPLSAHFGIFAAAAIRRVNLSILGRWSGSTSRAAQPARVSKSTSALFSVSSGTERVVRWDWVAARSHKLSQKSIPVDDDAGYGGDGGLTLQLENSRASVTTGFEAVDSQRPIRRMY
jgi:hypothetical protein